MDLVNKLYLFIQNLKSSNISFVKNFESKKIEILHLTNIASYKYYQKPK